MFRQQAASINVSEFQPSDFTLLGYTPHKYLRLSPCFSLPLTLSSLSPLVCHSPPLSRQALGEVTAALREKLHRWQQLETLTGLPLVNNPGLPALAAALNLDPAFLGLHPPTPHHLILSDDLDDMDEDILSSGTLQYAAWQMDRRVSDLWPMSGISDSQSPWKYSGWAHSPCQS
uniref:Uncharacterized protein n=1 Tax=Hucho hucho TaxID=62062 RepID=A0A4W5LIV7_9TELE